MHSHPDNIEDASCSNKHQQELDILFIEVVEEEDGKDKTTGN